VVDRTVRAVVGTDLKTRTANTEAKCEARNEDQTCVRV
jgi:hypothetical protein